MDCNQDLHARVEGLEDIVRRVVRVTQYMHGEAQMSLAERAVLDDGCDIGKACASPKIVRSDTVMGEDQGVVRVPVRNTPRADEKLEGARGARKKVWWLARRGRKYKAHDDDDANGHLRAQSTF